MQYICVFRTKIKSNDSRFPFAIIPIQSGSNRIVRKSINHLTFLTILRFLMLMIIMYLPVTLAGDWDITQKIIASDYAGYDYFGSSVSVHDTYFIIGATGDDDRGSESGSVYIYRRDNDIWSKTAKLAAGDGSANDNFGKAVSLYGNYAIIGSKDSAYIVERELVYNMWMHTAKLVASDHIDNNLFGSAVSMYENYTIVGSYGTHAAYVFERDTLSNTWVEKAKLNSLDLGGFGFSVDIHGDYIVIGAPNDDDKGSDAGSAYIFERSTLSKNWTEKTKLLAGDGVASDQFGYSVAIYYNYVVIGAPYAYADKGSEAGSVYIYERNSISNVWTQKAKLVASDGASGDQFGYSVSIYHSSVAIGAVGDAIDRGSVYIYERNMRSNIWINTAKLGPSDGIWTGYNNDKFGYAVSIYQGYVIIGAIGDDRRYSSGSVAYSFYSRGAAYSARLTSLSPTEYPTPEPTKSTTKDPTEHLTKVPTQHPTKEPTTNPTKAPTKRPTTQPTEFPSRFPTITTSAPTFVPTIPPTELPTKYPTPYTVNPTAKPTEYPSEPTVSTSSSPTTTPTDNPTLSPTDSPTASPTANPTMNPTPSTNEPSFAPTEPYQFDANIYWSALDGVFCSNINENIKFIDDINEIECKIECIDNEVCDTVSYFHLIEKTQQSRCYLFHHRCNGYSFTNKLSHDVSTYLLYRSTVYDILSNCINYPRDWKDILSESCHSYNNSHCRNNNIIDGELQNILSYKDDVYQYSAKDVCCVCGAGVYEYNKVMLYPYITTAAPIDICSADWNAFIQNITMIHGTLLPKFREWNASHILDICEAFLFKMQYQYGAYGTLNQTTCYSVVYNGSTTICSNISNMDDVFTFNAMHNLLYINEKWINASIVQQFDNIHYSDSCDDYMDDNDAIMRVTPCKLLQNISSLFPRAPRASSIPKKPQHLAWIVVGSILGFVAVICIIIGIILLSKGYKIVLWKSKSIGSVKEGEIDPIMEPQPGDPRVQMTDSYQ